VAAESTGIKDKASAQSQEKVTRQSVPAPSVKSEPLDNIYRVVNLVQQIMIEFNDAVSERENILAITNCS
jgi:hypothetical protein